MAKSNSIYKQSLHLQLLAQDFTYIEFQYSATIFVGFDFFYRQQQCIVVISITNGPARWEIFTFEIVQNFVDVFPKFR